MKKTLLIIFALLMTFGLSACGSGGKSGQVAPADEHIAIITPQPQETAAVSVLPTEEGGEETAEPTAAPSLEPSAAPSVTETPAPTQQAAVPRDVEEAIAMYQGSDIGYAKYERDDVPQNVPITEPRYTLGSDGIYHSSASTNDNEAVIMLTGDLMCQTRQQLAAQTETGYDFREEFEYLTDLFSKADLLVGNLEATVSPTAPYMSEQAYVDGSPHLNCPVTFLEAVRYAGFDLVMMSNNHNCDLGVRGIYDTLDRVDRYKLMHTGLFRNSEETRYVIADVDGIKVGFLGYATYFNHKEEHLTREGKQILINAYSKERVENDVRAVRAAGAEYVMVYIHWGVEYENDPGRVEHMPVKERISGREFSLRIPLDRQYQTAQELADAGVDYIIGSHPHAVQPYDVLTSTDGRSVPVIYSMGNFVSHQKKDVSKDTMILRIVLVRDENGSVTLKKEGYVPARMHVSYKGRSYTVIPLTYPYRKDNMSDEFLPAYTRITKVVGGKLAVMGTF